MRKKPALDSNEELERVRAQFPNLDIANPLAILSVPKCGTMLLRNIMYMFWDIPLWHEPFVENHTLRDAFARSARENIVCTGHLEYLPETCKYSRGFKRLVLVRDPAAYVLSYARFMLSAEYQSLSKLGRAFRDDGFTLEDTIRFTILGISHEHGMIPDVLQQFTRRMAFAYSDARLVRYEELRAAAADPSHPTSVAYFENLLAYLGIAAPEDLMHRVAAGADVSLSTTARENLTYGESAAPRDYLKADELRLLEAVAPGLRRTLGYG